MCVGSSICARRCDSFLFSFVLCILIMAMGIVACLSYVVALLRTPFVYATWSHHLLSVSDRISNSSAVIAYTLAGFDLLTVILIINPGINLFDYFGWRMLSKKSVKELSYVKFNNYCYVTNIFRTGAGVLSMRLDQKFSGSTGEEIELQI